MLEKNQFAFAVGTAHRINQLLTAEQLTLTETKLIVIDASWQDGKKRTYFEQQADIQGHLMDLLQSHLFQHCISKSAKIALF